jgi:small multidrug resistance family-3 protein
VGLDAREQTLRVGAARSGDPGTLRCGGRLATYKTEFGRVYAAYGGIFIALSLAWGMTVDSFRPDRYDLAGALICVVGVVVMVAPSRS